MFRPISSLGEIQSTKNRSCLLLVGSLITPLAPMKYTFILSVKKVTVSSVALICKSCPFSSLFLDDVTTQYSMFTHTD